MKPVSILAPTTVGFSEDVEKKTDLGKGAAIKGEAYDYDIPKTTGETNPYVF